MEIDIKSREDDRTDVYFRPNLGTYYHWIVKKDKINKFVETKGIYYIENPFNSQMLNNVLRSYFGFY